MAGRLGVGVRLLSPVVGVGNHAIPIEHSTDVLLRPVSIGELAVDEAACCSIQRPSVFPVVASSQQGQQGPRCVDHMGAIFWQLMVLLHKPANQTVAQGAR